MNRRFEFYPSVYLAAVLCFAHGAVLAGLPLLALPGWSKLLLAAMVLFSLVYHLWRDAWLRASDSCRELLLEENDVVLTLRNGEQLRGAIASGSLVTPYLTVLSIAVSGRSAKRGVVILPDGMDRDAFRQLRVWLKWGDQETR